MKSEGGQKLTTNDIFWLIIMIVFEVFMVVMFGLCFDIGELLDPKNTNTHNVEAQTELSSNMSIFMNVNVMVWAAFPVLYTYLKYNTLGSAVMTFFCGLYSYQFYFLCLAFFKCAFEESFHNIKITITWLIEANFGAAVTMITVGGVLGKFNIKQYFFISVIEPIFCALNYVIGEEKLHATDCGGSMYVHSFGAFFGFALCCTAFRTEEKNNKVKSYEKRNSSTFNTDTLAFFGTLLLWLYWPSFNTGLISGVARYRGVINTWFALLGSGLGAILTTFVLNKGKLSSEDVLNATLAGGVMIGGSCNIIIYPFAALIIGLFAGFISTIGFEVMAPFVKKIKIYDTAGIINLHGITGFFGAIFTSIFVRAMDIDKYGDGYYYLVAKLADRSKGKQAGFQILAEIVTIAIAVASGLLTGLLVRIECIFSDLNSYYSDGEFFLEEHEEESGEAKVTVINVNQNPNKKDKEAETIQSEERLK